MANKDRQKRSVRQARAREREALEAAQSASMPASDKKAKVAKAAPTKEEIAKKEASFLGRTRRYFHDVHTEMNRVVWPSKTELTNYSTAVIALLIIVGVIVWLVDTGFVGILVGFTGLRG